MEKLDDKAVAAAAEKLPEWHYDPTAGTLSRQFAFKNFIEAFGFMTQVALLAQSAGHHPDWSNSYSKVSITLSTHDAGGVTGNDVELAGKIDRLLN